MDIGIHAGAMMEVEEELNVALGSTEQGILAEIEGPIGARKVTKRDLDSVQEWQIIKSMDLEE